MEVYLDLIVILNYFVDLLLLIAANRLSGFPTNFIRCSAAAGMGGLYGGICLLRSFRFLGGFVWRLISLICISLVAYGGNSGGRKRMGIFLLLSMSMGGIALSIGKAGLPGLLLSGVVLLLLSHFSFGDTVGGREYVPISITYGDRHVNLIAMRDSGNCLRDPISGESVLLITSETAQYLTGLSDEQIAHPFAALSERILPGLRLIPYRAIGCDGGMLLALRFDQVKVDGVHRSAIIAFAPFGLDRNGVYQALVSVE